MYLTIVFKHISEIYVTENVIRSSLLYCQRAVLCTIPPQECTLPWYHAIPHTPPRRRCNIPCQECLVTCHAKNVLCHTTPKCAVPYHAEMRCTKRHCNNSRPVRSRPVLLDFTKVVHIYDMRHFGLPLTFIWAIVLRKHLPHQLFNSHRSEALIHNFCDVCHTQSIGHDRIIFLGNGQ